MLSKGIHRQLRFLAVAGIALLLLATSAMLTVSGFVAWHYLSTRPYHRIPLSFFRIPAKDSSPAKLEAVVDLTQERLRSVANMEASITLSLPESQTNIENSVFQISSSLLSSDNLCVAHDSSTATLTFRSPVHRAVRATVFIVPMLLGIIREYQTVTQELFRYNAFWPKGIDAKLSKTSVEIYADELQIESAYLTLRVRRTTLFTALTKEGRISSLALITVGIWYFMVCSLALLLASISFVRRVLGALLRAMLFRRSESSGRPPMYGGSGPPPRKVLIGHDKPVPVAETGQGRTLRKGAT